MTNAIVNNKWTMPSLVFDGGYNCSQNGGANGKPIVSVSNQGTLGFSCLSKIAVIQGCKSVATCQTAGKGSGCGDFFDTCG